MARTIGFLISLVLSTSCFAEEPPRSFFLPWYEFSSSESDYLAVYGIQQISTEQPRDQSLVFGQFAVAQDRRYFTEINGRFYFHQSRFGLDARFYTENWWHSYYSQAGAALGSENYLAKTTDTRLQFYVQSELQQRLYFITHHRNQLLETQDAGLFQTEVLTGINGDNLFGVGVGNMAQWKSARYQVSLLNEFLVYNESVLSEYSFSRLTSQIKQSLPLTDLLHFDLHQFLLLQQGSIPYGMHAADLKDYQYWFAGSMEGQYPITQGLLNRASLLVKWSEAFRFGAFFGLHEIQQLDRLSRFSHYGGFLQYQALQQLPAYFQLDLTFHQNQWSLLMNILLPWNLEK